MLAVALLAAALGAALFAAWLAWEPPGAFAAALAWLLYAPYEYLMHARMLCSGECNIRVDLLLWWPILFALTLAVPLRALLSRWRVRQHR